MSVSRIVAPVTIIILLFLTLISTTDNDINAENNSEFMNGISFVAPPREFKNEPFKEIKKINADWVAIMPYAFSNENSSEVHFDHDKQWWGERKEGVIKCIELARGNNLRIFLKPHVWVRNQGWTGDFSLSNESDWKAWEKNYSNYIISFAKLADSLNVEAFCVGLEFKHAVRERPEFWLKLIEQVRGVYSGKLAYAANWDNYKNIRFWDKVDFIGINAYFPLSMEATPSVEQLRELWLKEKNLLSALSKRYHKPIVFTEFGYRSIDSGAGNQWELEHHRKSSKAANFTIQENAYQALFETFWNEPWFLGGFLWKWYPELTEEYTADNTDYTPQGKPVEKIITAWYKKR